MKILELSKEIYSSASVDNTINAFNYLVVIKKTETRRTWRLIFRKCKYDEMRTILEFENYLIGIENQNGHH